MWTGAITAFLSQGSLAPSTWSARPMIRVTLPPPTLIDGFHAPCINRQRLPHVRLG